MIKVLLTHEEIEPEQYNCLPAELIATWFVLLKESKNFSAILKQWKKYKPLVLNTDDNIEILNQGESYCIINVSSVVRMENVANETFLYLNNGYFISTSTSIKIFEDILKEHRFFLIHPNHLINVVHMKSFVKCNAFVTMSNRDAIPVTIGNDEKIVGFLSNQDIV